MLLLYNSSFYYLESLINSPKISLSLRDAEFFNKFYIDKEKDIQVHLYRKNIDELVYVIRTPNHKTGNLITNLAKIFKVDTVKDENDMKIITGTIPARESFSIMSMVSSAPP